MNNYNKKIGTTVLLATFIMLIVAGLVTGDPTGSTITSNTTDLGRTTTPASRADDGGTFTTLNINAIQQNYAWKAYLGNITGSLVLDDSNNISIYQWSLSTLTGEILATRNDSLAWGSLGCASDAVMASENTFLNMASGDGDNINSTFSFSNHKTFIIAGNTLANSTCPALATYVNLTAQADNETALFQQILINDSNSNLIFVGNLEINQQGYDNSSQFDFQMILPDDDTASAITTYYFYVELDS